MTAEQSDLIFVNYETARSIWIEGSQDDRKDFLLSIKFTPEMADRYCRKFWGELPDEVQREIILSLA